MPRFPEHQQYYLSDIDGGSIVAYCIITRVVDSNAMILIHVCGVWYEESRETKRNPIGQPRLTI